MLFIPLCLSALPKALYFRILVQGNSSQHLGCGCPAPQGPRLCWQLPFLQLSCFTFPVCSRDHSNAASSSPDFLDRTENMHSYTVIYIINKKSELIFYSGLLAYLFLRYWELKLIFHLVYFSVDFFFPECKYSIWWSSIKVYQSKYMNRGQSKIF